MVFSFSNDIVLSPLALPKDILHNWINDIQDLIAPNINRNTQSMWDILEQLKTRPTFEEQWDKDSAKKGAAKGKAHLLKLESLRNAKVTMDDILAEYKPAQTWWRNI